MKEDQRGKVIDYLNRKIPKNEKGDPHFKSLSHSVEWDRVGGTANCSSEDAVLSVFSPEEVVVMVNRFLYQQEYQREFHRRMERRKTEETAPLKKLVKEMFNLRSWSKATPEQLLVAKQRLREL